MASHDEAVELFNSAKLTSDANEKVRCSLKSRISLKPSVIFSG